MFWDASALVPCLVEEASSAQIRLIFADDEAVVIWWGTPVECASALERRKREGLSDLQYDEGYERLREIVVLAQQVPPHDPIRECAGQLLRRYQLRALDALQLAAARVLADRIVACQTEFVSLDRSLREAAKYEGLTLVPE